MIPDLNPMSWWLLAEAVAAICIYYFWWGRRLDDEAGRIAKERGEYGTYVEGVKDALSQDDARPYRQGNISRYRKFMDPALLRSYRNGQIALWIGVAAVVSLVIYRMVVL